MQQQQPIPGEFSYFPADERVTMAHYAEPTKKEGGICCTIFGMKENFKSMPNLTLKTRIHHVMETSNLEYERTCVIQVCDPNSTFRPMETDNQAIVLPSSKYLEVLEFINKDWNRACAKLISDCKNHSKNTPGGKGFKLDSNSGVYVRGAGAACHTFTLGYTATNDKLQFKTHCFMTNRQPTMSVSLGYDSYTLGNATLPFKQLPQFAKDIELLKEWIVYKGKRNTFQMGNLPSNPSSPQQQQQQPPLQYRLTSTAEATEAAVASITITPIYRDGVGGMSDCNMALGGGGCVSSTNRGNGGTAGLEDFLNQL